MASILNTLPFAVGDLAEGAVAPYVNTGVVYNHAIGGVPFLSAVSPQTPSTRETAPYRKDQFDNGQDPGEQSIVTWWLRSQSSFHGGGGLDYEIPYNYFQPRYEIRYADSTGVDVWTPGKVTLLKKTVLGKSAGAAIKLAGAVDANGADCYLQAEGSGLSKVTDAGSTSLTWGGSGNILSLVFDGKTYYAANATSIFKDTVPASGAGTGTALWNTGNAKVLLGWVKQRLMACIGQGVYELIGGTPPTLPTPVYTHPNGGWTWTAITEGPNAIYMAGYAGNDSSIIALTLSSTGDVPTLTAAAEVAKLPKGEYVTALYGYLNAFLLIGTNRGVRVGTIDSQSGGITYGPLTCDTAGVPVYGFTGLDRFVYATVTNRITGKSGLLRIDLSLVNEFNIHAYANDLQTHATGTCSGVAQYGTSGRLIVGVDAAGSYIQSATLLESTGTLTTERIRFHTLDDKIFKFLHMRCLEPVAGSINLGQVDDVGNATSLITFDANALDIAEVAIAGARNRQRHMQFQFTLAPDVTGLLSPELHGYQVKALPGAKRQRQFQLVLDCYDMEKDRNGQKAGGDGWAERRLAAVEALEEAGDAVPYRNLRTGTTRLCVIDQLRFVESSTPSGERGNGGVLLATLRAVT